MKTGMNRVLFVVAVLMLVTPPLVQATPQPAELAGTNLSHAIASRFAVTGLSPPVPANTTVQDGAASPVPRDESHRLYRMFHQSVGPGPPPEPAANQTKVLFPEQSDLDPSYKEAFPDAVAPGDTVAYTIHVINAGDLTSAYLYDPLPWVTDFVPGSEWASSGDVSFNPSLGQIEWLGDVPAGGEVQVGFQVTVSYLAAAGQPIVNTAYIYDYGTGQWFDRPATSIGRSPFTGYDNSGKTVVDSCYGWECDWFECADECGEMY